jgi:hypothetical protein
MVIEIFLLFHGFGAERLFTFLDLHDTSAGVGVYFLLNYELSN